MKKALCTITTLVMVLSYMFVPGMTAYAADITIGLSSSSVQIGDTITATVMVPDNISGTLDVSFSNDVLEFSIASAEVNVNGRNINISIGKFGLAASRSVTLTFRAKTSGTASIKASGVELYDHNSLTDVTLGEASVKVTVANEIVVQPSESESEAPKSADNSLSSLKLSAGTLSPAFKYNVTKYTATVNNDVTQVVVSAVTSNEKAVIESVTGNGKVSLNVGQNRIEVVVRAENGVKAVYEIIVTRKEKEQLPSSSESESQSESESASESESQSEFENAELMELLQWNGEQLKLADMIPAECIPADFTTAEMLIKNHETPVLDFTKGNLPLLYLLNTNGAGALYAYDEERQTIYPFIKLVSEKGYVMVLMPDEENVSVPDGFKPCTLSLEGKGVVYAYQTVETEFYLIYCMNNQGEQGWYFYDSVEGTFQRYLPVSEPEDTETAVIESETPDTEETDTEKAQLLEACKKLETELAVAQMLQYMMIGAAAIFAAAFIIVLIILLRKNKSNSLNELEIDDSEDDFFDSDEVEDDEIGIEFYEMTEPSSEAGTSEPVKEDDNGFNL